MTTFAAVPDSPIACSLPAVEMGGRLRDFDELFAAHLHSITREPGRLLFVLSGSDLVESDVRDLLQREHACCSFLDFELRSEGAGLTVEIRAPDGAEAVLDSFTYIAERAAPAVTS